MEEIISTRGEKGNSKELRQTSRNAWLSGNIGRSGIKQETNGNRSIFTDGENPGNEIDQASYKHKGVLPRARR